MTLSQIVRCPNCGSKAKRTYFNSEEFHHRICASSQVIQTECPSCDYLMVTCSRNADVVEVYAPGIIRSDKSQASMPAQKLSRGIPVNRSAVRLVDT